MDQATQTKIEAIKTHLAKLPKRDIKPATETLYVKTAKRLWSNPAKAYDTTSKKTYYLRRAALNFYAAKMMETAIEAVDFEAMAYAMKVLIEFAPEAHQGANLQKGKQCPIKSTKPRKSKRTSLKGLPRDWREQMLDAASTDPLRDMVMILSVAGARPEEFTKGIEIKPIAGGVQVTIKGAKTDRGHGQPTRVIEALGAIPMLLASKGARTVYAVSANAVSSAINRLGRRLWPKKTNAVSAYSFRHQFASEVKSSDVDSDEASMMMGHANEQTKKNYGHANQGKGTMKFKLVFAERRMKSPQKSLGL